MIAELTGGSNNVQLSYTYRKESANLNLKLNYDKSKANQIEPVHLVIYLSKDSKQTFDMDPKSKLTEKNDLQSAIKRFRTMARMWQAFTSEDLNNKNLGLKSFRLKEDSTGQVIVNIVQSKTRTLNDLYKATDNQMYNLIADSILNDESFLKNKNSLPLHVTALILDSHWDNQKKKLFGHTALGGGFLGIFGSIIF